MNSIPKYSSDLVPITPRKIRDLVQMRISEGILHSSWHIPNLAAVSMGKDAMSKVGIFATGLEHYTVRPGLSQFG